MARKKEIEKLVAKIKLDKTAKVAPAKPRGDMAIHIDYTNMGKQQATHRERDMRKDATDMGAFGSDVWRTEE